MVICSSGAIGLALGHVGLPRRPKHLPEVQALAAIGQCKLMSLWDQLFMHRRQSIAQILLTRSDIADRTQYLNAQNTFTELLHMGTIPIVNENDTLSVAEIKFGDNDTLSAFTAAMVQADYLFLMTDVPCLYDKNPRQHPDAEPIQVVENISDIQADVSSAGSSVGTGGMSTKIIAARLATSAGVTTVICKSSEPGNIADILRWCESQSTESGRQSLSSSPKNPADLAQHMDGMNLHADTIKAPPSGIDAQEFRKQAILSSPPRASALSCSSSLSKHSVPPTKHSLSASPDAASPQSPTIKLPPLHTRFLPVRHPIRDRSFWILHGLTPHGTVYIDNGAYAAIQKRAGLLPVGVLECTGNFAQQECVRLIVRGRTTNDGIAQDPSPTSDRVQPETSSVAGPDSPVRAADANKESTNSTSTSNSEKGLEVGRALVNYSSTEIRLIKGLRSSDILGALGYADGEYVALRENIAFF